MGRQRVVAGAEIEAGQMVGIGDDMIVHPTTPPFAYEVECDGQRVRLEAPTLAGLLDLMERTNARVSDGLNLPLVVDRPVRSADSTGRQPPPSPPVGAG